MNTRLSNITIDTTKIRDIYEHLVRCDKDFIPRLSSYVDLKVYSKKVYEHAKRYEIWEGDDLVAFLGIYLNKPEKFGFITNLSLEKNLRATGEAKRLFLFGINDIAKLNTIKKVVLEVHQDNHRALKFYNNLGFLKNKDISNNRIELIKHLNG